MEEPFAGADFQNGDGTGKVAVAVLVGVPVAEGVNVIVGEGVLVAVLVAVGV